MNLLQASLLALGLTSLHAMTTPFGLGPGPGGVGGGPDPICGVAAVLLGICCKNFDDSPGIFEGTGNTCNSLATFSRYHPYPRPLHVRFRFYFRQLSSINKTETCEPLEITGIRPNSEFHYTKILGWTGLNAAFRNIHRTSAYATRKIGQMTSQVIAKQKRQRKIQLSLGETLDSSIGELLLDEKEIRKWASSIKSAVLFDLRQLIQHQSVEWGIPSNEVTKLIDQLEEIQDITTWDGKDVEHLVFSITDRMLKDYMPSNAFPLLLPYLLIMRYVGYFNPNARKYFVTSMLQQAVKAKQILDLAPLQRLLEVDTRLRFRGLGIFGRYDEFMKQVEFECSERLERNEVIKHLEYAMTRLKRLPDNLQERLRNIKAELENKSFQTRWPVIDKGYFEDSHQMIRNCELIIAHGAVLPYWGEYSSLRLVVKAAYKTLNHLWKFNTQDQSARKFLMDLLIAKDIQRSIYLHVLCDKSFKYYEGVQMELLNAFQLLKKLDDTMIIHLNIVVPRHTERESHLNSSEGNGNGKWPSQAISRYASGSNSATSNPPAVAHQDGQFGPRGFSRSHEDPGVVVGIPIESTLSPIVHSTGNPEMYSERWIGNTYLLPHENESTPHTGPYIQYNQHASQTKTE
ncbi:hypothetical protein CROQUDRAFT_95727 [Cronartium quercuum f. sp. fusiforme G11]|uniref:Uncharacterized protein n=1 Tax=Cronartium quercuum f. sp. fusiforme G11 TaxID=708437 RepID=A0A9P6TAR7_9BASI|nr:hypothetical protein CROQUDRAFT_95727 [Cronartium quercuum f. sp. fusiforme G11]